MARFRVSKEGEHLVILDSEPYTRPVIAFMPNPAKPEGPRFMAEVCVKALNDYCDQAEKKRKA
jgi:hypothetical protein